MNYQGYIFIVSDFGETEVRRDFTNADIIHDEGSPIMGLKNRPVL